MTPVSEAVVVGVTSHGADVRGNVMRWTASSVIFETPATGAALCLSEAIEDFRVLQQEKTLYSGRVVVRSVIDTGPTHVCEAGLNAAWIDEEASSSEGEIDVKTSFRQLIQHWQDSYEISPEFKAVVVDLQSFMSDLRMWLDRIEMRVLSAPEKDRARLARKVLEETGPVAAQSIDSLVEKFELLAERLPDEQRPAHRKLLRRLLHPLVLCAPFAYRSYYKPLGYAGDYGMVNMILGDPYQGETFFAKVINAWLLRQAPAAAHRNRLATLLQKLCEETVRVSTSGRPARIYSLGCGPAGEVQQFLAEKDFSDQARFTLVDFSEETLRFTREVIERIQTKHHRRASVEVVKKSVSHILKESLVSAKTPGGMQYDFVYCAGLFDYLTDPICRRLMNIFYNWLAPGGLLMVTNVDATLNDSRAFRHSMDYILDWNLIYRTSARLRTLAPDDVSPGDCVITAEDSGVNAFLEVRKPLHE